jgi:hypothetical protein
VSAAAARRPRNGSPTRPRADIEDITHKTGSFKRFGVFVEMLLSAITQRSDSVYVDLLTFADLVSLASCVCLVGGEEITPAPDQVPMRRRP